LPAQRLVSMLRRFRPDLDRGQCGHRNPCRCSLMPRAATFRWTVERRRVCLIGHRQELDATFHRLPNTEVRTLLPVDSLIFAGTAQVSTTPPTAGDMGDKEHGITNNEVRGLAFRGSKMFAATYGGFLFVSSDRGRSGSHRRADC